MNHQFSSDNLKAYIDGELGLVRRALLRRHLSRCAACREEKTIMENLGNELQAANAVNEEMPAALRTKLLSGAPTTRVAKTPLTDEQMPNIARSPQVTRGYRPSWKDTLLIGGLGIMLFAAVSTTAGKKVNTVFNTASDKLNTSTGGESDFAASSPAPQAAPSYAAGGTGLSDDKRVENGNANYGFADGHVEWQAGSPAAGKAARRLEEKTRIAQRMDGNAQNGKARGSSNALSAIPNDASDTVDAALEARRVHKEGSIAVEVDDIEKKTAQAVAAVGSIGGFVASNTLNTGSSGQKTANLQVRVPVGKFESVLQQIGDLGEVKAKNISGQDVTDKWANAQSRSAVLNEDLTLRETQLKAALERMKKKRHPGEIPWQMRSEVRELRIQAAQSRARLNLLRRLSELSDISIQLQEKVVIPGSGGFLENVGQTWNDSGKTFAAAARIPVNCIIWILAYSPLWLPLLIAWRVMSKMQERKTG